MNEDQWKRIYALRAELHAHPELSGHEAGTLERLYGFLKAHTHLELHRGNGWLLAVHWEGEQLETLGFRADMDAIPLEEEPARARHGCGHDGHCAILCALALALEGVRVGKNCVLIFQPAEEIGLGARRICEGWPGLKRLHRIYGLHNIPGYPAGEVLLRAGCFACASEGFIVTVRGRPAHASCPEDGANPANLLSRLVLALDGMIAHILRGDARLLMHTVVGLRLGGENFGLSAAEGRLCLTLRGYRRADLEALESDIRDFISEGCATQGMTAAFEKRDVFPDTTNPEDIVAECEARFRAADLPVRRLPEPMRWSEDFGGYLNHIPGMFFGIGAGEGHPGLHTAEYCFDDRIIAPAVRAFWALL